ncbi:uncharacterized protein C2845_PM06G25860 [Panicum miliaceum]|uniref:Uncharacterized protein n=1 Tax=Panicum miliaceum TaxID=4540 RepID=A0A3L6RCL4_PANMI|nr:uncharacterized protein C2845_PM06G25860 [Panicum miliaceum]
MGESGATEAEPVGGDVGLAVSAPGPPASMGEIGVGWISAGVDGPVGFESNAASGVRAKVAEGAETKMQIIDDATICESLGPKFRDNYVFLPALGTRGGALLAVNEDYYKILETEHLPAAQRTTKAAVMMYTAWNLWKERNRRIFEGKQAEPTTVLQLIKEEANLGFRPCGARDVS